MNNLRQVGLGILATLVTVAILLGSLSLAFMENNQRQALVPPATLISLATLSQILSPTPTLSGTPAATGSSTPSITPTPSSTLEASASPSASASSTPTPTGSLTPTIVCRNHPDSWVLITIHEGDTLKGLAAAFDTTTNALIKYNCLQSTDLTPGQQLYVPGPPSTATSTPCGPYPGWVIYIVQPGDTLTHLSQVFHVTVEQLMHANCLTSYTIIAGKTLWVPFYLPTSTPIPPRPTRTPQPTSPAPTVPTPIPSDTPVPTPIPSDTPVPTPIPSDTAVPTAVPTNPPKPTPVPSDTPVPTIVFTISPDERR